MPPDELDQEPLFFSRNDHLKTHESPYYIDSHALTMRLPINQGLRLMENFSYLLVFATVALSILFMMRKGLLTGIFLFPLAYLLFTVPKFLFLTNTFNLAEACDLVYTLPRIDLYDVSLSISLISIFCLCVMGGYMATDRTDKRVETLLPERTYLIWPILLLILPMSGICYYVAVQNLAIDLSDQLVAKRTIIDPDADGVGLGYCALKAAFIASGPVFLCLLSEKNSRWLQCACGLSGLVYVFYCFTLSYRTGIIILFLDIVVFLGLSGRLNRLYLAIATVLPLIANWVILALRDQVETTSIMYTTFLKRYFLDVEKVAFILDYKKSCGLPSFFGNSLDDLVFFSTARDSIDGNLHRFIGSEIMLEAENGIPPSIVGEAILYLGPGALCIIGVLVGMACARIKDWAAVTSNPTVRLIAVLVLVRVNFFLVNSDSVSALLKVALDLALLLATLSLYRFLGARNSNAQTSEALLPLP